MSNRSFIVTIPGNEGTIALYTFNGEDDADHGPTSADSFINQRPPTPVAELRLPRTKPGRGLRQAFTHSGPFVADSTPGRPFHTARDTRIHMFSLLYGDHAGNYSLFVHNRHLLSYVTASAGKGTVIVKDWEEWGPDNTRVVDFLASFQWLR